MLSACEGAASVKGWRRMHLFARTRRRDSTTTNDVERHKREERRRRWRHGGWGAWMVGRGYSDAIASPLLSLKALVRQSWWWRGEEERRRRCSEDRKKKEKGMMKRGRRKEREARQRRMKEWRRTKAQTKKWEHRI